MAQPTITGYALLGLLAIREWTAYELTQQMRMALRWAWPRSEANLYSEIKRLVPLGLAEAIEEEAGGRSRTRYRITERGRGAVRSWLASSPPSPPRVESEAVLRLFLADQGSVDDLRRTIADTRRQVIEVARMAIPLLEDYTADPPFPERSHLNVMFSAFFAGFYGQVLRWCDAAEAEIETWPGTTAGVGFTPGTRRMLEDALAFYRAAAARDGEGEA